MFLLFELVRASHCATEVRTSYVAASEQGNGRRQPHDPQQAAAGRLEVNRLQLGVGLGQIGEFSFVLATIGVTRNVIPSNLYAAILAAVVLTIAASTLLVRVGYARPVERPG